MKIEHTNICIRAYAFYEGQWESFNNAARKTLVQWIFLWTAETSVISVMTVIGGYIQQCVADVAHLGTAGYPPRGLRYACARMYIQTHVVRAKHIYKRTLYRLT